MVSCNRINFRFQEMSVSPMLFPECSFLSGPEVETGDIRPSAPQRKNWPQVITEWKEAFKAWKQEVVGVTSRVWLVPVWNWWVCRVGHCPKACSPEQDGAVLTPPTWALFDTQEAKNGVQHFPQWWGRLCHCCSGSVRRFREQREVPSEAKALSIKSLRFALLTFPQIWIMCF